jgi:hypothetical protein
MLAECGCVKKPQNYHHRPGDPRKYRDAATQRFCVGVNLPPAGLVHESDPRGEMPNEQRRTPGDGKADQGQAKDWADHPRPIRIPQRDAPIERPARLRQVFAQKVNLVPQLAEQLIHHPAIFGVLDVFDPPPDVSSFQLESLDFSDHIGFRIVNFAHRNPPCYYPRLYVGKSLRTTIFERFSA